MSSVLEYRLTGGAANADPNASLGGDMSSEQLSGTALNNLFANVLPPDIESGDSVRYRAIELYNNGDAEARNVEFYFLDTPNSESIVAVWLDVTGTQTIGDEETEPTGASGNWTTPLVGSKLSLDNLAVSAGHRLWIRRTVDQDADNLNDDLAELHTWAS
jgi:hypothetical protein